MNKLFCMKKILFFFSFSLIVLSGCENSSAPVTENNFYNKDASRGAEEPVIPPILPDVKNKEEPTMTRSTNETEKTYIATLSTSVGDIEITLNSDETPNTVKNFVTLSNKNFYDNTIFHRVIDGFMIQGGDPDGDGTGGPGYTFDDEPFTGKYTRGAVAMANRGPNTNGSQFFIMHADYPLPPNYTIFGRVTKGMEVVDKIATAPVQSNGREISTPVNPVKIKNVDIVEK